MGRGGDLFQKMQITIIEQLESMKCQHIGDDFVHEIFRYTKF